MRVSQRIHPQPAHHVEVLFPLHIEKHAALAAFHHCRIPGIYRNHVFFVALPESP